ncbi:MAG: hypothetical protein NVSMB47_06090 [Polyangiales bacterium]
MKEGDVVDVKVLEVGRDGKIRLSRRVRLPLPEGPAGEEAKRRMEAALSGGFGARLGEQPAALRLRLGYAWAPTLSSVTDVAGKYGFGGILFALDGVLRVD